MNEKFPQNECEKLERKLTALLLGELPAHEEAALHRALDEDPELAALYERLKVTIELVRSVESGLPRRSQTEAGGRLATPKSDEGTKVELKLPPEKREKLLAHFKTVRPKEFAEPPRTRVLFDNRKRIRALELAAVAAVVAILAAMLLPALSKAKSRAMRVAVVHNLRLIDGAKQTWALEANASQNAVPRPSAVAPYLGRGGAEPNSLSSLAVAGETYVPGKVGEAPGIETSVSQARSWMGGQRIPQDRVHNGRVELSMEELMDQKFEQNPAPQVAMNTPWQTRLVGNMTKGGPAEQSDSTLGSTQRGKGESQIVSQDASVWKEAISAGAVVTKSGEERSPATQPLTPREQDQTATFGFNSQSASLSAKTEIILPASNEAAGNEQLAMNNADFGRFKLDNGNDRFINGVNLSRATNWVESLDLDGGTANTGALGSTASTVSAVTNYVIFADSYSPQTTYRMLSQLDSGGGQTNLEINYTNLIAGTVRRAEAEIRADEAERLRQANRELSESKAPILGDIPKLGAVFQGELGPIETNGQFFTGLSRDDVSGLRYLPTNGVVVSQPIDGNGGNVLTWKTYDGSTNTLPTTYDSPNSAIVLADNSRNTPVMGQLPMPRQVAGIPPATESAPDVPLDTNKKAEIALPKMTAPEPAEPPEMPIVNFADASAKLAQRAVGGKQVERAAAANNGTRQIQGELVQKEGEFGLAGTNSFEGGLTVQGGTLADDSQAAKDTERTRPGSHGFSIVGPIYAEAPVPGTNSIPEIVLPSMGAVGGGGGAGQSFADRVRTLKQQASSGGKQVEMAANPWGTFPANKKTSSEPPTNSIAFASTYNPAGNVGNANVMVDPDSHNLVIDADVATRGEIQTAQSVQDGKLLFQKGKLDEADAKLKEALARDPNDQAALYYESLIKQITTNGVVAMGGSQPAPVSTNVFAANVVGYTASGEAEKMVELASAEQKLASEKRWRDILKMKTGEEAVDKDLPKARMVTIVEPATTATTGKVGLGEKLRETFSGKVERTTSIKVEQEHTDIAGLEGPATGNDYDPYFLQTEFNVIQSDAVLKKAAEKLNLDKNGKVTEDTVARLKKELSLRPIKNSKEIEIGARSETADQAARIANAVAEAYKDYRQEQYEDLKSRGIQSLQEQLADQNKKVELAEANVDELRKKELPAQTAGQEPDSALPKPAVPPPTPQPEMLTRENAFSTFSMNVSDVSFKLAAASLEKGQMPEPGSIRSEEFINAFDYRDPEAAPGVPVAFNYERALYPFAHNRELLRFSLKTAAAGRQAGRPLNVVLLLDNSGSMERADRVGIIQEALRVLAGQLQAQDTFSIVTFARTARLRVDGIPGNQAAAAADTVGKFTPEGGTDLGNALDVAYETALHHYLPNGDNRVVLLTDGAANLGDVDSNSLKQKVETHRKQGIALDCFGIGWEGYNDDLLEVLTRDGDGRYGFINTPEEASTEFVSQIAGALHVAAADVKVQVEFNPDRVISYRQIGYAKHQLTKEQFRDNTVAAAQIAAQEAGNALYTIEINPQGQGSIGTVRVRYKVPDTGEVREQSWDVPYTGGAVTLEQASPAMRLAATASAFSEWLATSPFAEEVTTDQLLNYLNGVPQVYGADTRPQKLEWMIRQAKSISGK